MPFRRLEPLSPPRCAVSVDGACGVVLVATAWSYTVFTCGQCMGSFLSTNNASEFVLS